MKEYTLPPQVAQRIQDVLDGADSRAKQSALTTKTPVFQAWSDDDLFVVVFGTAGFLKQVDGYQRQTGMPLPGVTVVEAGKGGSMHVTPHGGPLLVTGGGAVIGETEAITFEAGSDAFIRGIRVATAAVPKYLIRGAYVAAVGGQLGLGADHLWDALIRSLESALEP